MPNAITLRPSIVFGPEDDFFNRFAAMTLVSPALPLLGGGKSRFQPVYVGDVAAAIMAATKLPEAAGRTYELGGPAVYTFKELMQFVLRATAHRRLLLPVPWSLAMLQGKILEKLPGQLLTHGSGLAAAPRQYCLAQRAYAAKSRHHPQRGGSDRPALSGTLPHRRPLQQNALGGVTPESR